MHNLKALIYCQIELQHQENPPKLGYVVGQFVPLEGRSDGHEPNTPAVETAHASHTLSIVEILAQLHISESVIAQVEQNICRAIAKIGEALYLAENDPQGLDGSPAKPMNEAIEIIGNAIQRLPDTQHTVIALPSLVAHNHNLTVVAKELRDAQPFLQNALTLVANLCYRESHHHKHHGETRHQIESDIKTILDDLCKTRNTIQEALGYVSEQHS